MTRKLVFGLVLALTLSPTFVAKSARASDEQVEGYRAQEDLDQDPEMEEAGDSPLPFDSATHPPRKSRAKNHGATHAHATPRRRHPPLVLSPGEMYRRTKLVLKHFRATEEPDSQREIHKVDQKQTAAGVLAILEHLDPDAQFTRFKSVDGNVIHAFQDRDSKKVTDFTVKLAPAGTEKQIESDLARKIHSLNSDAISRSLPLNGLRVAIDPGHMGGDDWDEITGKYIQKGSVKLSEGVLTLQTALLLEKELKALGADVMITRRGIVPVVKTPMEQLDLVEEARSELVSATLTNWFQALLTSSASDTKMLQNFDQDRHIRERYSDAFRKIYFLSDDLDARAEVMMNHWPEWPDLSIVIHYDTADITEDFPHIVTTHEGIDRTKAYVPGGFVPSDFASREDRKLFAQHLFDQPSWNASLHLGRSITHELHCQLDLPYDSQGGNPGALKVEPGIFARNLVLSRRLTGHAVTYVETLYYNAAAEFKALSQHQHTMMIGGESYPYSDRMVQVVKAYKAGILNFVTGFENPIPADAECAK